MNASRRRFGTDQKAAVLKRYLVEKAPISDLCDEYGEQALGPGGKDRPAGGQAPAEERGYLRGAVAGHHARQVPRLAAALRQGQRAQCPGVLVQRELENAPWDDTRSAGSTGSSSLFAQMAVGTHVSRCGNREEEPVFGSPLAH